MGQARPPSISFVGLVVEGPSACMYMCVRVCIKPSSSVDSGAGFLQLEEHVRAGCIQDEWITRHASLFCSMMVIQSNIQSRDAVEHRPVR